jgi:radical SAM protein with 4Fe4S-binding SPASM domain
MACYVRPEYTKHVFAEAKRFTDFMFEGNAIVEQDLINGLMPCIKEMNDITVIPIMTIFDFLGNLGVKITTNEYQQMQLGKRIEITTAIGCPIACNNCPQDILCERYSGQEYITLSDFKDMLKTVPTDYMIVFSGYAEPFLNINCTDMILYAHEKGYRVGLYTTMVGMSLENDWERIKHIPFLPLVIHIPTKDGGENINVDEEYFKKLKTIKPHNYSAHGEIDEEIKKHMFNAYIMGEEQVHDRAGLVGNGKRTTNNKGEIFCITDLQHPVLVPNGDLYVCCQDFGLTERIGNLHEKPFMEIMVDEPIKNLRKRMACGEAEMCSKCIMSRTKE